MALRKEDLATELRVGAYLRISADEDQTEWGTGRQRKIIITHAEAEGIDPSRIVWYVDNDRSAKRGVYREDFERLLGDVKTGRINHVLGKSWDRFERNGPDRERIITLAQERETSFVAVRGELSLDLRTHYGALVARILGAVAEMERDEISQRCVDNQAERADTGEWAGGPVPYGYRSVRLPNGHASLEKVDAEAKVIVRMAKEVLAGSSLREVARGLNADGIAPPRRSKAGADEWIRNTVRAVLIRPTIAGIRVHRGKEHGKAKWEPILDVAMWRLVQARLTDPSRRKRGPIVREYLLTGLVTNEDGLEKARAHGRGGIGFYEVTGAKVRADYVEELVVKAFLESVERGRFGTITESVGDDPMDYVAGEMAAVLELDAKIADYGDRAALDEDDPRFIDEVFALSAIRKFRERKKEHERIIADRMATFPRKGWGTVPGTAKEVKKVWNDPETTTAMKREILATFIERVEIFPRGGDRRVRVVLRREDGR